MNTDLPIFIDRAVDLAAHEGTSIYCLLSCYFNYMLTFRLSRPPRLQFFVGRELSEKEEVCRIECLSFILSSIFDCRGNRQLRNQGTYFFSSSFLILPCYCFY